MSRFQKNETYALSHLDGGYTVFRIVTGGMDVVDEIDAVETIRNDMPV